MSENLSEHIISVYVTPKSSFDKIIGIEPDQKGNALLKIKVTSAPENGQANKSVIKLLSKSLRIPKSNVTIIKGKSSRYKQISLICDSLKYDKWIKFL